MNRTINNIIIAVLLILLGMILGLIVSLNITGNPFRTNPVIKTETVTTIDTIYHTLPSDTITIEKMYAKRVYIRDTIIETRPFVATIDTVIMNDTIRMGYSFPENYFSLQYRSGVEEIPIPYTTIIETKIRKRAWWELPVAIVGGGLVGYAIGK